MVLPQKFFNRPAPIVSKDLLGKILIRKINRKKIYLLITEVEAYDGFNDKASHASKGKTPRNSPMFDPAGIFYVYFTYGMHYMLNIVTGPKNYPSAVLIRGGIIVPPEFMRHIKHATTCTCSSTLLEKFEIINGPARLTKFLKINKKFNGLKAIPKNDLWFMNYGFRSKKIVAKKRIGIGLPACRQAGAGKIWSDKKWNFSVKRW